MTEQLNDPLLALWAERESLDVDNDQQRKENDPQAEARAGKQFEVERRMSRHTPLTLEGAVVLVRVLKDYAENGAPEDDRQVRMCDNLIVGLEIMDET